MKRKRYLFFVSQDYSFAVLRPLQREIRRRGDEVKWFLYGDEVTYDELKEDEMRLHSVEEIVAYRPDAVFVPGNVVPSFIPGLKVEVFHGLPSTKAKKSGQLYHYIIRGMFDLYCTQGPESTKRFKALAKVHGYFCAEETGWCKLDPLFWEEETLQKDSERKTIFFASTFSPRFSKAKLLFPFVREMITKYDFDWYITLHPKMDPAVVSLYRSLEQERVRFVSSADLTEAFKRSDMMLCDTSSIIYEFLTQLKPVVTFQTERPQPHLIDVTQIEKLEETILHVLENPQINRENIEKSVMHAHPYRDGKSSARVLDTVEKMLCGVLVPPKKKPLNLIRNLKLRKELGYWRW